VLTFNIQPIVQSHTFRSNKPTNQYPTAMTEDPNLPLFPRGEQLTNGYFTGDAYLQPLLARDKNNPFAVGHVSFEPGARTNWHTHPRGKVLIITEGSGFYQEKGKAAQPIRKGDVINIPEDVEHWHGAAATTKMAHIAITNFLGDTNVVWLQPVSDDEFSAVHNK
jgi:quercetin dioxygenase-like cupin family protein